MRTPRLLFVVNSLVTGGAEKHVVTLLNHLDASRFQLHLAYLKRGEDLLPQLHRHRLASVTCCDVIRWIDLDGVRRLRRILVENRIDAIVCTNSYSTLYGRLAMRGCEPSPRLVTVFHTTVLQTRKEKMLMLLYRRLFSRCDLLVYVSENQRRYWRERGLDPVTDEVVHNGIDTDWYREAGPAGARLALRRELGFAADDYVIGICSALRPEKAHGVLLAAIARLRAQGIAAKGLLIGDGPERPAIERAAARLGLAAHVRISGVQEDVRPYIGACDVMTLVSHTETFSLAALESMSLGKPLVMSDVGGAREQMIPQRHGFLFEPGNIDALTTHLTALTSAPLRAQVGAAAARRVRELFTVQRMAGRFTGCMDRLLDGSPASAAHCARDEVAG